MYGAQCEPQTELKACEDAACARGCPTLDVAREEYRTLGACVLAAFEDRRACWEAYACTAALEHIECAAACEVTESACLDGVTRNAELDVCRGTAERCWIDCGIERRSGRDPAACR